MPIYRFISVQNEPEVSISAWSIREVTGDDGSDKTQHLVGYIASRNSGRVTSAIQSFDRDKMCIKTNSGRIYYLVGPPGFKPGFEHVWMNWKKHNQIREEVDVTYRYWRLHLH
jgi:hypothetical protein